ncbi:MAG: tRNA pseudouridine(38-40) synthase TruA [Bacteroidota bacterium]
MTKKTLRYFLQIAYKGTQYCGWQRQHNATTVQGVLDACMAQILKEDVRTMGSSRTDKGVHAQQQFAHVDLVDGVAVDHLHYQLNAVLPKDIAIVAIRPVVSTAHARFDALARTYVYTIVPYKTPFQYDNSFFFCKSLDIASMNEAAEVLCRKRDFRSLCKKRTDDEHFLCTIMEAAWSVQEGGQLTFRITANRFLRGMVRSIVSLLLKIGQKEMSISGFETLIDQGERDLAASLVPARGLTLLQVTYPETIFLT